MSKSVLILNGPGLADAAYYGRLSDTPLTLASIHDACAALAAELDMSLEFRQTDDRDEMTQWLTSGSDACDGLIVNPGEGVSTTPQLTRRYLAAIQSAVDPAPGARRKPVIEVRLGNIFRPARATGESGYATVPGVGLVCGLGQFGYLLAMRAIARDVAR